MCMENVTPLFAAMLKELDKRDGDGSALSKLSIIDDVLHGKKEPALLCVEMPDGINMEITGYYPITAEQFEAGLTRRSSRTTTVGGVKYTSGVSVIAGIHYQYTEIRLPYETVDKETGSLIRQIFAEMDAYYDNISSTAVTD